MTLYEADLDKIAVEVKSVSRKTKASDEPKTTRKRKAAAKVEDVEPKKKAPRKRKSEPIPEPVPEPTVPEPIAEPTPVAEVKVEEPKVEEPKVEEAKVEEVKVEEVKQKKPRAPRKKRDPAEAPVWFAKYVEGVKKEQSAIKNEKVPAKKVKEEAQEAAAKSWNHGLTRNRVQNEVDGHMSRMYSMIFSK
jgi:translation initiation factor 4G